MGPEAKELLGFLHALLQKPDDLGTRQVLADWLEEHDEPEAAAEQRAYCSRDSIIRREAEAWLRLFCEKYVADYDELLERVRAGAGYSFGDDDGPYAARDPEFWDAVDIVLGEEPDREQPFRCGC